MEWLRKALVGIALAAGIVASVATSSVPVDPAVPPSQVMGEGSSESFTLSTTEIVRTGTIRYETVGAVAAFLSVTVELESGFDVADFEVVVVHGIHPETAESLEARYDGQSGRVFLEGTVVLGCDGTRETCVHEEPFLVRVTRLDDSDVEVLARLRVSGTMELADEAGASAQDAVLVEIDAIQ